MKIKFHRLFKKAYKRLPASIQSKVLVAIEKFTADPYEITLQNHPLSGRMKGKRAFSATGSYRVVFEEHEDYVLVVLLDVGTHVQVYE